MGRGMGAIVATEYGGRNLHRLSARTCQTVGVGLHADGGNLYLQVRQSGDRIVRSWIVRYKVRGTERSRDMGLGPLHSVSLAQAREEATKARAMLFAGLDPIEQRQAQRRQVSSVPKFKDAAAEYIAAHRAGWSSPKHGDQWTSTLTMYAEPMIGDMRVDVIQTEDVLRVLRPIWTTKTETATRVRQRVEQVLSWCTVQRQRTGENPARWRGHLDKLLPKASKVSTKKHFPALPYDQVPAFMALLREREGLDARALELTILTASRTSMTLGAKWSEFADATWTIPASRMKTRKPHTVPIVPAAQAVVDGLVRASAYLFPGHRGRPHLSTGTMDALLERMGFAHVTVHGFRSSFKDWASEVTNVPNIVSEAALAHVVADKTEAAYRRGELLAKRRELMQEWAAFCYPATVNADPALPPP